MTNSHGLWPNLAPAADDRRPEIILPLGLGVEEERAILARHAEDQKETAQETRRVYSKAYFNDRSLVVTITTILIIVAVAAIILPWHFGFADDGSWIPNWG